MKAYQSPELPSSTSDLLEQLAREGARQMIQKALLAECDAYLGRGWYERSDDAFRGHRNGQGNERSITLGSGTVTVRVPRVANTPADQPRFQSAVLAAYQRRSGTVAALIPRLWVEGLATRDFEPALRTMLGEDAALSASTVSRLNAELKAEFDVWRDRRLDGTRYAYMFADGFFVKAGLGNERAALLVVVGITENGDKELLALREGYAESTLSWCEVLRDLRARGMNEPLCAVADGALGFWEALAQVFPGCKTQRCLVHKIVNIVDKLPHAKKSEARRSLKALYEATDRETAKAQAFELAGTWQMSYRKAADCLIADLDECLTYFDFPPAHWKHLKTSNPIESIFAPVRLRTNAAKRFRSQGSAVYLIFHVVQGLATKWRRCNGYQLLPGLLDSAEAAKMKEVKEFQLMAA